jgi:hypothetical protein
MCLAVSCRLLSHTSATIVTWRTGRLCQPELAELATFLQAVAM